jgi:thiol-disulfide isomerase/thioredoxin
MKINKWILLAVGLLFALLGATLGLHRWQAGEPPADSAATDALFAQTMNDPHGQPLPLAQWKGKALVVNFWATWCPPCVEEMPELSALQTMLPANMQIIGIGIDSAENIAEFAKKYQISYPLYIGGIQASELSRQLGNQAGGLPFTVLIGADGKAKKTYLGRLKMEELRKDLNAL